MNKMNAWQVNTGSSFSSFLFYFSCRIKKNLWTKEERIFRNEKVRYSLYLMKKYKSLRSSSQCFRRTDAPDSLCLCWCLAQKGKNCPALRRNWNRHAAHPLAELHGLGDSWPAGGGHTQIHACLRPGQPTHRWAYGRWASCQPFFFFFFFLIFNFIFGCAGSTWLCGFSLIVVIGGHSSFGAQSSLCSGFGYCGAQALI